MSNGERPQGQRFSQLYLERGAPGQDSVRMRRRIAALVRNFKPDGLMDVIETELGIDVPVSYDHIGWEDFFADAELRDVLDTVTLVAACMRNNDRKRGYHSGDAVRSVRAVGDIFTEENLHYEVDDQGGVHLSVDQEFERNRASTLAGLGAPRYVNVAQNFEASHCYAD